MTVFIAHAEADRPAAEALEKFLERRGLFVELEDGARGFRHVQNADTVVALWSKDSVFSPYRLLFEKRTLEAWADEQLVMVKLDHAFSPVGLRDLPSIDASFEPQRDIAWSAVAKTAQDLRVRPAPAPQMQEQTQASRGGDAPVASAAPKKKSAAVWLALFFGLLLLLVVGTVVFARYTLSGSFDRLPTAPPPEVYQSWLPIGGAVAAFLLIGVIVLIARAGRGKREVGAEPSAEARGDGDDPLFVSYAHADNLAVVPVVEAVQAQGRSVWIDKQGLTGGDSWAGEIVRAIKGAKGVIVMCSKHAFESDHVKREVYLADRYKKPMVPVFIEAAPPPEDFEYFFAGVQWLELHKTPLADRAAALAKALKAV